MNITADQIQQTANQISINGNAFIAGKFVSAVSNKSFECISPIDGKKLVDVASCDKADVDLAVRSARQAFDSGVWSKASPVERKKVLLRLAELIDQHLLELAVLETLDMGKPISNSLSSDIPGAAKKIRWIAECIDKVYGEVAPTSSDILATITREPVGVVGAVVPWNYPFFLACGKLAPALAMGNSVIIKPAEQSPLTAIRLVELAAEAGVPEGVVQVLPGYGETAGQAIGLHPDVDMVAFTGSGEVGRLFMQYSAQSNMKRLLLECGGKSPNVILADCFDLDEAVKASSEGVFYNQGETCCAPTRLLVQNTIKDQVLERMSDLAKQYQPNHPLLPDTFMGAMIDQSQTERVMSYIATGQSEGAQVAFGGQQVRQETGGYYIEPTVFFDVRNDMKIAREEIFGPVISVIGFNDMAEAIRIANDTHYGLAASVWTGNLKTAHRMAREIRAGVVSVNVIDTGDNTTTFGGYKESGIGRTGGLHQFDHYTELKTTWIKL